MGVHQGTINRIIITSICIILLGILIYTPQAIASHAKRILVLHSFHQSLSWDERLNRGLEGVLKKADFPYELYHEYLDTKRTWHSNYYFKFASLLRLKYSRTYFDLIIAFDNNALDFLLEYKDSLFPTAPVIFAGINDLDEELLLERPDYKGVKETISLKETLNTALSLHPQTEQVIIYGNITRTYLSNKRLLQGIIPYYEKRVDFVFRDRLRLPEIIENISNLPENSIVLLMSALPDEDGNTISYARSAEILAANSPVPIYGLWDFFLNHGIVGGKVVCGMAQGQEAGKLALAYLSGKDFASLPHIVESPNQYIFDYNQLQRFKIQETVLPEGSNVVNKPDSFWVKYRSYVFAFFIFLMITAIVIYHLVTSNIKLNKIKKRLSKEQQFVERLVDTAEVIVLVLDQQARILGFNSYAEELTGYKEEEVIGEDWHKVFVAEEETEKRRRLFSQLLSSSTGYKNYESNIVDKDGKVHLISWHDSCLKNDEGKVEAILSIGINITEQRKIEETLKYRNYHDDLTGLPNMKYFREKLAYTLKLTGGRRQAAGYFSP